MAADIRKITVHVPEGLLAKAQRETGKGVTETVRRGLELLAAQDAFKSLRQLRGKLKLDLNLEDLRADRK